MAQDWRYYVPPNLRGPLSEAGRVGYNLLDNLIGFDDEYDTTGELLARSLREDPLGTLGSMAGGLYEGAKTAVTQPVQTAREAADEFANTFLRLREPLPEDATREDISQRTGDLSLLASLIPGGALATRAVPSRRPDVLDDPWANLDFDNLPETTPETTTLAEELMDAGEPPADWLADAAPVLQARRAALIEAFGGEEDYFSVLDGPFGAIDYNDEARNLGDFVVLERTVFDPEDGPQPVPYTVSQLAAMSPDEVRALAADISNDPSGYVYRPELVEMLADMTQQELAQITGLPIQPFAGAWTGFQQTPFDPDDIDFGPDIDQIAAGADTPAVPEQLILQALEGPNPWANVQDAEDLAANYVPSDPYSAPYGAPRPDLNGQNNLFSPATRAAVSLEQPRYGSVDEVISNLRRQGATSMEIDLLRDQGVFDRLAESASNTGFISKDTVIDLVGNAPRLNRADFTPGQGARYEIYFPPGAENYRESVFSFGQQPSAYDKPYYQTHFEEVPNAVFHMRTGEFTTSEGGRAFHVGEIQSDLGGDLRDVAAKTRDYNRPLDMSPLEWKLSIEERAAASRAEVHRLTDEIEKLRNKGDTPEIEEQYRLLNDQRERARRDHARLSGVLRNIEIEGDSIQEFGLPTYGSRNAAEVRDPVPIARDTSDYTTAAIARAFSDAVDAGADFLTFNTGDMMQKFSGGLLSGQRKAYDDILPRNLEAYAKRLADEYGIEPPAIERITIQGRNEDYIVPGIRLTPELRALAQTQGLPSYKNGGIVSLLHN